MAGVLRRWRFQTVLCRCSCSGSRLPEVSERPLILCSPASRRMSSGADAEARKSDAVRQQLEAAARENRLDFFTAAKILFSTPTKPKKFGLDFHLWQFFVALLPPFAVYLTAQYARYEMRRMEKERDEAEQLKLQAAVAEELAAQLKSEESKSSELSSTSVLQSPSSAQGQKVDPKLKSIDEPIVVLPEKDFLSMKARLDAMENKMKLLESARPGTTFIPPESEANPQRESTKENVQKPAVQAADRRDPTKENVQKPAVQVADQGRHGGEHRRDLEKQKDETPPALQNQKDLQVSQSSGSSWFGFGSKPKEREQPE